MYSQGLLVSTSAKIVIFPYIKAYMANNYISVINNTAVSFAAADNDIYWMGIGETT